MRLEFLLHLQSSIRSCKCICNLPLKNAGVGNVSKEHACKSYFHAPNGGKIPSEFFIFTDESAMCDRDLL
ncbi:hypothetical protein CROQUDRAFT_93823 [Cronartium quercuum f. sp. fusiforme G11]|uniref:Uncharacterized protein n=1 Tax=Cronartium quercuum f. sp. fusiforme G11 TaxID=708437 RepID=A0A9P6NG72_9BASI|nr:hypothetical protein CROQUDRAFT_93823 [Cronartium quercuum f. sp. fusiforme G11]